MDQMLVRVMRKMLMRWTSTRQPMLCLHLEEPRTLVFTSKINFKLKQFQEHFKH